MLPRELVIMTVAVGCTIAAGVSAYTALARKGRAPAEAEFQPRVCESCGHAFPGPPEPVVTVCPICTARAAMRVSQSECRECGVVCGSYYCRYRDTSLTEEEVARLRVRGPEPELEYRTPGGAWGPYESLVGQALCPQCGGPAQAPEP
jgi:hypothetical protein